MSFQDLMNQPLPSATKVEENANNEFDADAVLQEIEESVENTDNDVICPSNFGSSFGFFLFDSDSSNFANTYPTILPVWSSATYNKFGHDR